MKIFMDTEFTGLHQNTSLISIGLVSEDNDTFYAEFNDYDKLQLNDWLNQNVVAHLNYKHDHTFKMANRFNMLGNKKQVTDELKKWLEGFDEVVFVSDCLAYDWVLFCELFGGAFGVPTNVRYIPIDICTMLEIKGIDPDISRVEYTGIKGLRPHHALDDAILIKHCYNKLIAE